MESISGFTNLAAENASLKSEVTELKALVKFYEEQLKLARHRQFGASSEKNRYDAEQVNIFNEAEADIDSKISEPELVEVERHYRKSRRQLPSKLPEDLPVEIVEHDLPESERNCPECNEKLHVIGRETVRRELKIVPAKAVIVEHVRKTYACRNCDRNGEYTPVIKAPIPQPVIKGSFASPESVAHVISQKFVMGVPLYRQEQEWKRNGILLSRQTSSNWLVRCTDDWLRPIYIRMKERLLMHRVGHADETHLQVLHEPGKSPQSKSYMWLYRTSGDAKFAIVIYEYQPDRRKERPWEFLRGFEGYLHTDGYEGYHNIPENIVIVGCWAHVRRKFNDVLKPLKPEEREGTAALKGKAYCDRLFALERKFAALTPEDRFREREKSSKPLMEEFFAWLDSLGALPKSGIGTAVSYALKQRKYLEHYLLDGRLEISNNRAERSLKGFVVGRKNWLFNNTPEGAQSSAIIYSLVETAKENSLNPYEYLTWIFKTAPNMDIQNNPSAIDSLLPDSPSLPDYVRCQKPRSCGSDLAWDD